MLTILITFGKEMWADFRGTNGKWVQRISIGLAAVAILVAIIVAISIYDYFAPSKTEQAIENRTPIITQTDTQTGVQAAETNKAAQVSSDAEKRSQGASSKVKSATNHATEVSNRDSNQYSNSNAGQRFCARFPGDSTCK